jgi:hypothetical protein
MRQVRFEVRAATRRWLAVATYAVAMAYVESAAVLYLRTLYGGIDPAGPRHARVEPLPDLVWIELGREAATLVMLGAVGYLASSRLAGRLGAFAVALGVWDIFYYVFLWLFAGWPASVWAADVLFLLPLPWWGPVVSPVVVAAVIVVAGAATMARELGDGVPPPRRRDCLMVGIGAGLCLLAFMTNALLALPGGIGAAFSAGAGSFPWPIYGLGVVVGAAGLARGLTRANTA